MTKYAPLTHHLKARTEPRFAMGFAEIEQLLGFPLPRSARSHRPWWANSSHGHVQSRAWLDAGFESREVDLAAERLEFVRLNAVAPAPRKSGHHPLWGCMAGTLTIAPGVDLTDPMFTEAEIDAWVEEKAKRIHGLLG